MAVFLSLDYAIQNVLNARLLKAILNRAREAVGDNVIDCLFCCFFFLLQPLDLPLDSGFLLGRTLLLHFSSWPCRFVPLLLAHTDATFCQLPAEDTTDDKRRHTAD